MSTLSGVDNTSMLTASPMLPEEILVLGEDDAVFRQRERELLVVRGTNEIGVGGCADIHASQTQTVRHGVVYILVNM